MPRIVGVDVPDHKRIEYGLTYIFGVGLKVSQDILKKLSINFDKRGRTLTAAEIAAIEKILSNDYDVEGQLRKKVKDSIKRLTDIGSYRGTRHKKGLPVHGQRTKTNARTRKGPKRRGGQVALKRKVTKK